MQNKSELIEQLVNCLQTSNMLLNTYHNETAPGEKKSIIQKMIDTNTNAIVLSMEMEAEEEELSELEEAGVRTYVGIPIEDYSKVVELLTEIKDDILTKKGFQNNIDTALQLLTTDEE